MIHPSDKELGKCSGDVPQHQRRMQGHGVCGILGVKGALRDGPGCFVVVCALLSAVFLHALAKGERVCAGARTLPQSHQPRGAAVGMMLSASCGVGDWGTHSLSCPCAGYHDLDQAVME